MEYLRNKWWNALDYVGKVAFEEQASVARNKKDQELNADQRDYQKRIVERNDRFITRNRGLRGGKKSRKILKHAIIKGKKSRKRLRKRITIKHCTSSRCPTKSSQTTSFSQAIEHGQCFLCPKSS
jgi:hypothetical protein